MEMLQAACQQFIGKREEDIRRIALETLEGHQRAIMGNMTVEVKFLPFLCHHDFLNEMLMFEPVHSVS